MIRITINTKCFLPSPNRGGDNYRQPPKTNLTITQTLTVTLNLTPVLTLNRIKTLSLTPNHYYSIVFGNYQHRPRCHFSMKFHENCSYGFGIIPLTKKRMSTKTHNPLVGGKHRDDLRRQRVAADVVRWQRNRQRSGRA